MEYLDIRNDDIATDFKPQVLLVTATIIETERLHHFVNTVTSSHIYRLSKNNQIYYLFSFNDYHIVHTQCDMGSVSPKGSTLTTSDAISEWHPNFVLMVGIAFGKLGGNQKLGDVLISKTIVPY